MSAYPALAFFLRHNNDIDHMIPVAYALAKQGLYKIHLIITTHPANQMDPRLKLLAPFKTVSTHHVLDFAPITSHQRKQAFTETLINHTPDDVNFPEIWEKWYSTSLFVNLFEQIFGESKRGAVIFDWTTSPFVRLILNLAAKFNIPSVSLPHGVKVFSNMLTTKNHINFETLIKSTREYDIYDHIVLPNRFWYNFFVRYIDDAKLHVLGSPRFCTEWRDILSNLTRPFEKNVGEALRVVFFLRDQGYDIFWEEVIRTYLLILQFPNVHLLVRHHRRSCAQNSLREQYPALFDLKHENLTILTDRTSSSALVDWADIIVDSGTSLNGEAVLKRKPLLSLEYLHPNRTILVDYITSCDMRTRDDLFHQIAAFSKDKTREFYNEDEVQNFCDNVINHFHQDVLECYVNFFDEIVSLK